MAFTTPAAKTDGQLVTAADWTVVRGDLVDLDARAPVLTAPVAVTGINGIDSGTPSPPQYWTETVTGGMWVKWRGFVYTSGLAIGSDPLFAALPAPVRPVQTVRWPLNCFIDNSGIYLYTLEVDNGGLVYLSKPLESTAPAQPDYVALDGVCWFIPEA